jgi:hypothetical protein
MTPMAPAATATAREHRAARPRRSLGRNIFLAPKTAFGLLLSLMIAAAATSFRSVLVIGKAPRRRRFTLQGGRHGAFAEE